MMNEIEMIPCQNFFLERDGYTPQYLILHGTAGGTTPQATAQYFISTQGTANPVSSHYIIGKDGKIVQCVDEKNAAFANGVVTTGHDAWWNLQLNPNFITISIEHVKGAEDNSDTLTAEQQASSFALIKDICQRWSIPMYPANEKGGITGHFSIDPVNRARCPGTYPWAQLWEYLHPPTTTEPLLQLQQASQHFLEKSSNDTIWVCTNGYVIGHAILDFYRHCGNTPLYGLTFCGLPVSNEIPVVECPGVVEQYFERVKLRYDPEKRVDNPPQSGSVYLAHIDHYYPSLIIPPK